MGPNAESDRRVTAPDLARANDFLGPRADLTPFRTISGLEPDDLLRRIAAKPYPVYLWGDNRYASGRYSILAHSPKATLQAIGHYCTLKRGTERLTLTADPIDLAVGLASRDRDPYDTGLPFAGGAIGYITYEHALSYLGISRSRNGTGAELPPVHFAFYDGAYVYDHRTSIGYVIGDFHVPDKPIAPKQSQNSIGRWFCSVEYPDYALNVRRILDHIAAGDIYQANYTLRFETTAALDHVATALRLRTHNPSPLGGFLGFPFGAIWSCSPELLLSGEESGRLESRPIKGTRGRHPDLARDAALRSELTQSSKDRAELLMIVDLIRNDLGRVAQYGSVEVETLFGARSFATVHHLESTVTAQQRPGTGLGDVLRALLPGGSVTGAPKRRAVEILRQIEVEPRSVYTGALGYISSCGRAQFNLPIRTAYQVGSKLYVHSGGGIVADSDPDREWEEMLTKIAIMRSTFEGLCKPR